MANISKHKQISHDLLNDAEYLDTIMHGLASGLVRSGIPLVEAKVLLANALTGFNVEISYTQK